jgi:Uma2 family endonuclease
MRADEDTLMTTAARQLLTPAEYLAIERAADRKSEYYAGEMFAMAGASEEHVLITGNVVRLLGNQLEDRPCRVYPNDLRVKVSATGLYTYPDVVVVCGERLIEDEHGDTLLNPTVIIEVLSPTTEAYDRGDKFEQYRQVESLQEYVLIAQDRYRVERYLRQTGSEGWLYTSFSDPQSTVTLSSIGCELALERIYAKVDMPKAEGVMRRPPGDSRAES